MTKALTNGLLACALVALAGCDKPPASPETQIAATDAMSHDAPATQIEKVQLKPGQWEGRFVMERRQSRAHRECVRMRVVITSGGP